MRALIGTAAFVVGLVTVATLGLADGNRRTPSTDLRELRHLLQQTAGAFDAAADAAQVDPTPPPQRPAFARFTRRWRDDQGHVWFRLTGTAEAGLVRRERGRPLADPPDLLLRLDGDWWYYERVPNAP